MVLRIELRRSWSDVFRKIRMKIEKTIFDQILCFQYYMFRALKFRIPRWISMMITLLQLTQMIVGCWINVKAWQYKRNGEVCQVSDENLKYSLIMYATYFVLFAQFFLGTYFFKLSSNRSTINDEKNEQKKEK